MSIREQIRYDGVQRFLIRCHEIIAPANGGIMSPESTVAMPSKKWGLAFIIAILICVVLNPLNSSTISVALPKLLRALHTTSSGITWIVSAYYLGSAIAQPVMGKFGDKWGRERFVYAGLLMMIVTAVLAPLSTSLGVFVFWRIIQAVGTSMIYPNAIGLVRQYRSKDLGKVLGWIGMAGGIAVAVGPTIGGFLIDLTSWHAIFWLNIPISLLAMGLLLWIHPRSKNISNPIKASKPLRTDWAGIVFFAAAVSTWLLYANARHPFANPELLTLGLSALLTLGLIVLEFRHDSPVIPVRWFRLPQFALSSLITVITNLVMYCILYGLPVFLETARSYSATKSGLLLLSFAGVMSIASPLGGHFAQGKSRKWPIVLAGLLLFFGTFILCWMDILPIYFMILGLALIGVSFAISNVVIQQIVLESAPPSDTGQASGVYTLLRYIGTILSSLLVSSAMTHLAGAVHLFIWLTIASVLTILLSLGLRDLHQPS